MEGQVFTILRAILTPAHWVAGQVGLPAHVPAVELAVGLVFITFAFGLALHGLYAWLRSKKALPFVAMLVGALAGVVGLFATVLFSHAWLYTLILSIIAADLYWRLMSRHALPKQLRRSGLLWAAAGLLLCAGTPALFLIHTWGSEQKATRQLEKLLASERTFLLEEEQARISATVTSVSESDELKNNTFAVGDPLLVSYIQRTAVEQKLPYLVLLDSNNTVLARSQPVAAFGDTWPVAFSGLSSGTTQGVALSERGTPLILSARPVTVGSTPGAFTLVGGIQINQPYLTGRAADAKRTLFLTNDYGITALAAPEGKVVNALSTENVDAFLAERSGKAGSFSLGSDESRYLVRTLALANADGKTIASLGTAIQDTGTEFRLRFDLVVMVIVAIFVLALPAIAWRKREGKE